MGVRQNLKIDRFNWDVTIYYTVDDSKREEIINRLIELGCNSDTLKSIRANLEKSSVDTGFTYSSYNKKC